MISRSFQYIPYCARVHFIEALCGEAPSTYFNFSDDTTSFMVRHFSRSSTSRTRINSSITSKSSNNIGYRNFFRLCNFTNITNRFTLTCERNYHLFHLPTRFLTAIHGRGFFTHPTNYSMATCVWLYLRCRCNIMHSDSLLMHHIQPLGFFPFTHTWPNTFSFLFLVMIDVAGHSIARFLSSFLFCTSTFHSYTVRSLKLHSFFFFLDKRNRLYSVRILFRATVHITIYDVIMCYGSATLFLGK